MGPNQATEFSKDNFKKMKIIEYIQQELKELRKDFSNFRDNHFAHLQDEVQQSKQDLWWIKKIGWTIIMAVGTLIAILIPLIINLYNK